MVQRDRVLNGVLGGNKVAVCSPKKPPVDIPVEVIYLTMEIHRLGVDSADLSAAEITTYGWQFLKNNPIPADALLVAEPEIQKALAEEPTQPPSKPEPPVAPKPKQPASVVKAIPAAPAAKPKAPPTLPPPSPTPPTPAPPRRAPVKAVVTKAAPTESKVKPAPTEVLAAPVAKPVERPKAVKTSVTYIRPNIPHVVGVVVMNLLNGVSTVLEPLAAAGDADSISLQNKINELTDEVHRHTTIPTGEKEAPTVAA